MKYAAKHSAKHMESSKPVCRHLPSFVFILFIFGFAIWFLINPKADYSSSEKRYLQKFPTVTVNSVLDGKFGTDFEKYFADHFPMRTQWVGANAYFNLSVGNNGADGVYNCKNGYLINKPILDTDTLESNVQTIADFAKSVDVPVTVTLVPSTGYIANDVLPAVHDTYTDDEKIENAQKVLTESGADFVTSPCILPDVGAACKQLDMLCSMGAATANEAYQSHLAGSDLIKLFPGCSINPMAV